MGGGTSNRWPVVAAAPRAGGISTLPIAGVLLALIALALRAWAGAGPWASGAGRDGSADGSGQPAQAATDLSLCRHRALAGSSSLTLGVDDLNGFKNYNDSFGHLAGEHSLRASAHAWRRPPTAHNNTYKNPTHTHTQSSWRRRICVLIEGANLVVDETVVATLEAGSRITGQGWDLDGACNWDRAPADPQRATLRVPSGSPDQPGRNRGQAERASLTKSAEQLTSCCRRCASATPISDRNCMTSARRAAAVGETIGSGPEELDALRAVGELHDIGKVAIPDAILLQGRAARPERVGHRRSSTR